MAGTNWPFHAYVPVSELFYTAFRSNAKGLLPPNNGWRGRDTPGRNPVEQGRPIRPRADGVWVKEELPTPRPVGQAKGRRSLARVLRN